MRSKFKHKKLGAFSLVELLIVMGIIVFVSGLLLPGTITQIRTASLNGKMSELSSQIYLYQQNAYYGLNNKTYGIRFGSGSYTIFIGPNFASAESSEVINLEPGMSINNINFSGGGSDLIFTKGTLKANTSGSIQMTDSVETYQLTINSEGFVEYIKI